MTLVFDFKLIGDMFFKFKFGKYVLLVYNYGVVWLKLGSIAFLEFALPMKFHFLGSTFFCLVEHEKFYFPWEFPLT